MENIVLRVLLLEVFLANRVTCWGGKHKRSFCHIPYLPSAPSYLQSAGYSYFGWYPVHTQGLLLPSVFLGVEVVFDKTMTKGRETRENGRDKTMSP